MRLTQRASAAAAIACAAACLPSVSAQPQQQQPLLQLPSQQRAKIVPRFRPSARQGAAPPLPTEHHTHRLFSPPMAAAGMGGVGGGMLPAADGSHTSTLVSRILQVALGLFVTTMELPPLPPEAAANRALGFDCDFAAACRWSSVGATPERWRLARGEPDVLLWLAATGTMVLPAEPFTLIEVRGGTPVDMLSSEVIGCQREPSLFSFTYWTVGLKFRLVGFGNLSSRPALPSIQLYGDATVTHSAGQVALKIPPVKHPFRIAIIPSADQGILILDDIHYDAKYCGDAPTVIEPLPLMPTVAPEPAEAATTTQRPPSLGLSGPTVFPFLPNPTSSATVAPPPATIAPPMTLLPLTFTPIVPPYFSTSTAAPSPSGALPPWNTFAPPLAPFFTPPPPASATIGPNALGALGGGVLGPTPFPQTAPTFPTQYPYVTPTPIVIVPEPMEPFITTTTSGAPSPLTARPGASGGGGGGGDAFDLMIMGNKTSPLFDRRRGEIVKDPADLLCDFANNFPCLWGPSAGKWAIIERGAIPSLDVGLTSDMPTYPAAVVIQGAAMLTSDPLRCQSGEGKLLFRYWTNGRVLMQVCAMGHNLDSAKIQCVEEVTKSDAKGANNGLDPPTLAVFTLSNVMREPFTLNIIPIFERNSHNNFIVIDEIAYLGDCNRTALAEQDGGVRRLGGAAAAAALGIGAKNLATPRSSSGENSAGGGGGGSSDGSDGGGGGGGEIDEEYRSEEEAPPTSRRPATVNPTLRIVSLSSSWTQPFVRPTLPTRRIVQTTTPPPPEEPTAPPTVETVTRRKAAKGTRYPFSPTSYYTTPTTVDTPESRTLKGEPTTIVYPERGVLGRRTGTTARGSFTIPYTTTQSTVTTTDEPAVDYCKLLNCDFNDNACNYLNHGLTKIPWTLRTKGYGFPLSKNTDLRPTASNGQFVSTVLGPGDFAILESPRFNLTQGINVLLFQYYRPTHSSTIRLCLGTRYTKPYRTVASFLQCPPILRSLTSKNAFKWNSVHIQLPPGTSHFYLVAHNVDRSAEKAAIGIDNIRVAICDPRNYAPPIQGGHLSGEEDGESDGNDVLIGETSEVMSGEMRTDGSAATADETAAPLYKDES